MKFKLYLRYISISILFLITLSSKADTGCQVGSVLYKGNESSNWLGNQIDFSMTSIVKTSACALNDQTSLYAVNIARENHWWWGDIRCRVSGSGSYNGYYVTYSILRCPIDDYIPAFMLAFAGVGIFAIRRRNLLPL